MSKVILDKNAINVIPTHEFHGQMYFSYEQIVALMEKGEPVEEDTNQPIAEFKLNLHDGLFAASYS